MPCGIESSLTLMIFYYVMLCYGNNKYGNKKYGNMVTPPHLKYLVRVKT